MTLFFTEIFIQLSFVTITEFASSKIWLKPKLRFKRNEFN